MQLSSPPEFGVNVIGYVSGNLGLGVLARNVVGALRFTWMPASDP